MTTGSEAAPIFIGGSGSSGSTLLSVLLDKHPLIACGPELSMFNKSAIYEDFAQVQARFSSWLTKGIRTDGYFRYYPFCTHLTDYGMTKERLLDWLHAARNLREFCDYFIEAVLRERQKTIFAEKTPSNAYCFPQLRELYPRARFIHIYRDGRDVVCSLRQRGFSWFQAASMWLYNTAAALRLESHTAYYALSYESLASDPEQTLQALCAFLKIPYDAAMLRPKQTVRKTEGAAARSWNLTPVSDPISARSVRRYKKDLSTVGAGIFHGTKLTEHAQEKLQTSLKTTQAVLKHLGYPAASEADQSRARIPAMVQLVQNRVYRHLQSLRRRESLEQPLTTVGF